MVRKSCQLRMQCFLGPNSLEIVDIDRSGNGTINAVLYQGSLFSSEVLPVGRSSEIKKLIKALCQIDPDDLWEFLCSQIKEAKLYCFSSKSVFFFTGPGCGQCWGALTHQVLKKLRPE